jgi:hypothetical protein
MLEQYLLEKCIQTAEDAKGSYTEMSHLDLEPTVKQMYTMMVRDMTKHLKDLNARLNYLKQQMK